MKKQLLTLLSAGLMLNLVGCATVGSGDYHGNNAAANTPLTAPVVDNTMDADDHIKLADVVNTAKPNQTFVYKSPGSGRSYEFTSYEVYVNEQGQPCRHYKVKAMFGFTTKQSTQVACRVDGVWQLTN